MPQRSNKFRNKNQDESEMARKKRGSTTEEPEESKEVSDAQEKTPSQPEKVDKQKESLKNSPLSKGLKSIQGALKSKDVHVNLTKETIYKVLPHIPTGAFIIDSLIGGEIDESLQNKCPGVPRGKIVNIYGHESSGKTTLALTTAAQICRLGGTCAYIDWEHAIVPRYAKSLGVPIEDPEKFLLFQPNTLEDGVKVIIGMARAGVDLVVIDSAGAAIPEKVFSQDLDNLGEGGGAGLLARRWSELLPLVQKVISESNTAMIAIGQTRSNISFGGGFGAKSTNVQGGNAWKFFSAVRLSLRAVKRLVRKNFNSMTRKKEDMEFGRIVRCKVDKCKISETQGYEREFYILNGKGIDNLRTLVDIACAYGIIIKAGARFVWEREDGEVIKGHGKESFLNALRADSRNSVQLMQIVLPRLGKVNEEPDSSEEEDPELDLVEFASDGE